jgi:hypothetical protein
MNFAGAVGRFVPLPLTSSGSSPFFFKASTASLNLSDRGVELVQNTPEGSVTISSTLTNARRGLMATAEIRPRML